MLSGDSLDNLKQWSANLKTARFARNWTLEFVADKVGLSIKTVKNVEAGMPNTPVAAYLAILALYQMDHHLKSVANPADDFLAANYKGRRARSNTRKKSLSFDMG